MKNRRFRGSRCRQRSSPTPDLPGNRTIKSLSKIETAGGNTRAETILTHNVRVGIEEVLLAITEIRNLDVTKLKDCVRTSDALDRRIFVGFFSLCLMGLRNMFPEVDW